MTKLLPFQREFLKAVENPKYNGFAAFVHSLGLVLARIPHLAQTSDAVNRQLSCFSSRYMNLLAVFQI